MRSPTSSRARAPGVWLLAFAFLLRAAPSALPAQDISFPLDSGVIDVTRLSSTNRGTGQPITPTQPGTPISATNAVPDDGIDDTVAIQAALSAFPSGNRIIYLPPGVYEVSDTLRWPRFRTSNPEATGDDGQREKRTILQGAGRDRSIIRLRPNSPGFGDDAPFLANGVDRWTKAVLNTGWFSADRFRNSIRDLSVEIGPGNPQATGIQFYASNQGSLRNVRIVGAGRHGLDLAYSKDNGPLLVSNLVVEGFAVGVHCGNSPEPNISSANYGSSRAIRGGVVLESIEVSGQSVAGIQNSFSVMTVRRLRSFNAVPAVIAAGDAGTFTLVDARLSGLPGASAHAALQIGTLGSSPGRGNVAYLRNISQTGYGQLLVDILQVNSPTSLVQNRVAAVHLPEYHSRASSVANNVVNMNAQNAGFLDAGGSVDAGRGSLGLAVRETPAVPWDAPSNWVSVTADNGGPGAVGNGTTDDTAAIQRALNTAAARATPTTVYFPAGRTYLLSGEVTIGGNVHRITGAEATVRGAGRFALLNQAGGPPAVIIERLDASTSGSFNIEQRSSRALIVSSSSVHGSVSTHATSGTGDVFLEDVVGTLRLNRAGQHTWARQLNAESSGTNIVNTGANLWILGLKCERGGVLVDTRQRGRSELFGLYHIITTPPGSNPMFIAGDSTAPGYLSYTGAYLTQQQNETGPSNFYANYVSETRGASKVTTTTLNRLFAAYPAWISHKLDASSPLNSSTKPDAQGYTLSATGTVVVEGSGRTTLNTSDICHFFQHSRPFVGDGEFVARLDSVSGFVDNAKAGLMLRAGLAPNAVNIGITYKRISATAANIESHVRLSSGAVPVSVVATGALQPPLWLRITRTGSQVRTFYKKNQNDAWIQADARTLTLPDNALAGLVVTRYDAAANASAGFSQWSAAPTPPGAPATPPRQLAATPSGAGRIALNWVNDHPHATAFTVERRSSAGDFVAIASLPAESAAYLDEAATPGGSHTYRVRAADAWGVTPASNEAAATAWTGMQAWRQTHFGRLAATNSSADDADPDGDGLSNFLEYAFGSSPSSAAESFSPRIEPAPGGGVVIAVRRAAAEFSYVVETSTDLGGAWIPLALTWDASPDGWSRAVLPMSMGEPRRFWRVRVGYPQP